MVSEQPKHISRQEADRLIVAYFAFAQKRAQIFAWRLGISDVTSCESEAMVGLMSAAQNYDPGRGVGFSAYAGSVIDYSLKSLRRKERTRVKFESRASRSNTRLCEPDHSDDVVEHVDAVRRVDAVLGTVTDPRVREAYLARIRGDSVDEIAARAGVHETTVRRWLWAAQGKTSA